MAASASAPSIRPISTTLIEEMIAVKKPVIFDCRVANLENCFPMIPSGKAHNEMLLPAEATEEAVAGAIDAAGKVMV